MPEIVRRKEAIGSKRYFTGKPCKHGHICERWSRDRSCCECSRIKCREVHARRRLRDPEWSKRENAKNYAKHRESRKAKMRADSRKCVAAARVLRELGVLEDKRRRAQPGREHDNELKRRSRLKIMKEDPTMRERENAQSMDHYNRNRERCQERHRKASKLRTAARRALVELGIQI